MSPVTAIDLLGLSEQEINSLPAWVPMRCQVCDTTFQRRRSTAKQAASKGTRNTYCSKACESTERAVTLQCEHCGARFQRRRCEVEKAKRNGWARTFCSVTCRQGANTEAAKESHTCRTCGTSIHGTGRNSDAVYCSKTCETRYYQLDITCQQCRTTFTMPRYEYAKRERLGKTPKYCSRECLYASSRRTKPCQHCGTATPAKSSRYCSDTCKTEAARARRGERKALREKVCPICAAVFQPRNSRQQYCDRECSSAAHSIRMTGRGNSNYKDGLAYGKVFRLVRPKIMLRDEMKCIACGALNVSVTFTRGGTENERMYLVVHHINENPADNRPENLVTLCQPCHMKHHKSTETPFPWFSTYAERATRSMTSRSRNYIASLLAASSSTTA